MLETDPSFRPVRVRDGCPPLEDLGLIRDGATVALVGLDIRTVRDFAAHEVARVLTGQPPLSPVNAAQLAMLQPRHSA